MKIHYDERADAIYIRLDGSSIIESEEVRPGIVLDFNEKEQIVGIEILRAKNHVASSHLKKMDFEVA